jgi:hypothetical protein
MRERFADGGNIIYLIKSNYLIYQANYSVKGRTGSFDRQYDAQYGIKEKLKILQHIGDRAQVDELIH